MSASNMSHEESLLLIESMIRRAKNNFSENGHLYLFWGWVVFICSLGHYALGHLVGWNIASWIWMLNWLGFGYTIYYVRKQKRQERVKTYTKEIVDAIWMIFIAVLFLLTTILAFQAGDQFPALINPVFLAIYGIPTILSSVILRFRPLLWGGLGCWLLALLSIIVPPPHHLLLIALAMVIAWIIPGYLLKKRYHLENESALAINGNA